MSTVLEVRDLSVSFRGGRIAAVRGVSFDVKKGETHCLVGESGCGKSVTALALMNLLAKGARREASAGDHYGGGIRINARRSQAKCGCLHEDGPTPRPRVEDELVSKAACGALEDESHELSGESGVIRIPVSAAGLRRYHPSRLEASTGRRVPSTLVVRLSSRGTWKRTSAAECQISVTDSGIAMGSRRSWTRVSAPEISTGRRLTAVMRSALR